MTVCPAGMIRKVSEADTIIQHFAFLVLHSGECYSPVLSLCMQHFLYFLPLPQGQGSLGPTLVAALRTGCYLTWELDAAAVPVSLATRSRFTSCWGLSCTRNIRRTVSSRMAVIMAWNIS